LAGPYCPEIKLRKIFYGFFIYLGFKIRIVTSVRKILALGQTDAEEAALLWARENDLEPDRPLVLLKTSRAFTPGARTGRAIACQTAELLENVLQSDGTLLLTLKSSLGPEQSKAVEFMGANKKPFLHLWSAVPQAGRLARYFLKSHNVRILNVVGSSRDTGEPIEVFTRSVFDALLISTAHV
jgi:Circularly permutated YpsA SLOG family